MGIIRVTVALLVVLLTVILPTTPAQAHAVLSSSDPRAESVVPEAPVKVTLVFSEPVQLVKDRIRVLAPDNSRADVGDPAVSGSAVTIIVRGQAQGTYLVSYRVVSADSHPIAGAFTYSVGATSTRTAGTTESTAVTPAVQIAIPIAKAVGYLGLLLVVGPVLVLALLWPHRLSRTGSAAPAQPHRLSRTGPGRLVWTGLALLGAATVAGLYLQAPYTTGSKLTGVSLVDLRAVLGSTFGAVMLVRLGIIAATVFVLRPLLSPAREEVRTDLAVLGVLGIAVVATWPLTGHPAASPVSGVSVVIDAVHLSAMAVWLGGLVMLVGFLLPRANDRELEVILPIWSRWATAAVSALIFAGIVQALIEIGPFSGFITTTYGRLLLVKITMVAVVLAAAGFARRLVRRDATGRSLLRRAVSVELGITSVILAASAVLVQTPPGRTALAGPAAAPVDEQTQLTLRSVSASVQVTVFPAKTGNNTIHLYAYALDGKPLLIVEWGGTAALASAGIEAIEIPLLRITENHAIGDIELPTPGEWQLRFKLRTSDIDQTTVTGTLTIG
jgi:copper transport protein